MTLMSILSSLRSALATRRRGIEGTEGAEPTLRIFWGEARWQRTQLLGELARDLVKGEGDP